MDWPVIKSRNLASLEAIGGSKFDHQIRFKPKDAIICLTTPSGGLFPITHPGTLVNIANLAIDECANDLDECGPLAICSDTLRSYECSCPMGFSGTGFKKIGLTGIDESCVRDANFEFTTTTFGDTTTDSITVGITTDSSGFKNKYYNGICLVGCLASL